MSRRSSESSDCLVWFGCSGDLGLKMTFPALFALERSHRLTVPVVGVACSKWTLDDFRARARDSIERYGGGVGSPDDRQAFDRLLGRLSYVDGDYNDPSTFELSSIGSGRLLRSTSPSRRTYSVSWYGSSEITTAG